MKRGTTPTHIFVVDGIELRRLAALYITYQQGGETVLEKCLDEVDISENQIRARLTQRETLAFRKNQIVTTQIRVRLEDGNSFASNIIKLSADEILKDGEI